MPPWVGLAGGDLCTAVLSSARATAMRCSAMPSQSLNASLPACNTNHHKHCLTRVLCLQSIKPPPKLKRKTVYFLKTAPARLDNDNITSVVRILQHILQGHAMLWSARLQQHDLHARTHTHARSPRLMPSSPSRRSHTAS